MFFFYLFTGQSYTDWKKPEAPKEPDKPQFPEEKKKEIMDKEKVWVSEPQEGFVLGQIVDLTDEGALVQPLSSKFKSIQGIIISNSKCNFTKKKYSQKNNYKIFFSNFKLLLTVSILPKKMKRRKSMIIVV